MSGEVEIIAGLDYSSLPAVLSAGQVARIFGSDPKTVTRWAKLGRLIAIETPGGHRRYPSRQPAILAAIEAIVKASQPAAVAEEDPGEADGWGAAELASAEAISAQERAGLRAAR